VKHVHKRCGRGRSAVFYRCVIAICFESGQRDLIDETLQVEQFWRLLRRARQADSRSPSSIRQAISCSIHLADSACRTATTCFPWRRASPTCRPSCAGRARAPVCRIHGGRTLKFGPGVLVLEVGVSRPPEHARELCPRIGRAHIDDAYQLNPRPRRFDAEQARGLASLNAPPEFPLGREKQVLIERISVDRDLDRLTAAGVDGQHRAGRSDHTGGPVRFARILEAIGRLCQPLVMPSDPEFYQASAAKHGVLHQSLWCRDESMAGATLDQRGILRAKLLILLRPDFRAQLGSVSVWLGAATRWAEEMLPPGEDRSRAQHYGPGAELRARQF
jgi:hypothetical protein